MVGARLWALPNWLNQLQEKNKRHEIQEHSGYRGDRDCCIRCWLLQPVRFFFDGSGDRARYRTGHRPSDRSGGSRRYGSGEVVPQKDPKSLTAALHRILADKQAWIREHQPKWDQYRAETSRAAAKEAFARLIKGEGEVVAK